MPAFPPAPTVLRHQAAQLVFARLGSNMTPPVTAEADADRIAALLDRCPLGGLVLFNGTVSATPATLARLQAQSRYPLLIGTDMERGLGQQVRGATVFPHARAFAAAADDEARIEAFAEAAAREALAAGVHITFAPVADVNSDPRNPIIGIRAFGETPEGVARRVRAYLRGAHRAGLLTCTKHFPGHGNTAADSHAELPVVASPRPLLDRLDLPPFQAAIDAGVDLVMTAHVAFPALDPTGQPATLSHLILHDLLRGEMDFQGAVITDSLLMGAIRASHPDAGAQAVALVAAGVDILLDMPEPEAAVAGLVAAVEAGHLPAERLAEACGRVWALKARLAQRFGPTVFTHPAVAAPPEVLGAEAYQQQSLDAARRAVTVQQAAPGALPLPASADVLAVFIHAHAATHLDPPEAPLGAALRARFPNVRYHEVRPPDAPQHDASLVQQLTEAARQAQHVVVAMVAKPAAWHGFGLPPAQQALVEALTQARPAVLAALGSPTVLAAYPHAQAHLCTYSDVPVAQQALAEALAGKA